MSDCMTFPDSVEEFIEKYKVVDTDCVYSNGIEFVPIFRMKQWFEHLQDAQPEIIRCKDCKYHRQNDYGDSWCAHSKGLDQFDLKPTDFCSRAKRKENR